MDILHHVLLHGSPIEYLEAFNLEKIEQHIELLSKGKKRAHESIIEKEKQRQLYRKLRVRNMFQALELDKQRQAQVQLIQEERMSDQESAKSLDMMRKLKIDQQLQNEICHSRIDVQQELREISQVKSSKLDQIGTWKQRRIHPSDHSVSIRVDSSIRNQSLVAF